VPTYTQGQSVFTLSIFANLGSTITGTVSQIEPALASTIDTQLISFQPEIGTWTVVWGPAVFQAPGSIRADNVMYVARGGADTSMNGQLVVAVAGTDPYSAFDWLVEDGLVSTLVPWPTGAPPSSLDPRISLSTFTGLSILQAMRAGPREPGTGTGLLDLLTTGQPGSPVVTVTGHSLGGALSPSLALFLSNTQGIWDPAGRTKIACLASAGPTPGNGDFATYFNSQLGTTTTRIWNDIDVVPHVWQASDIAAIPDLYTPDITPDLLVHALADAAGAISALGGYTQIVPVTGLGGTVNTSLINSAASDFENYFNQLKFQHVDAYPILLGVPKVGTIWSAVAASHETVSPASRLAAVRLALQRKLRMTAGRVVPPLIR
jgi:hypothetical protein